MNLEKEFTNWLLNQKNISEKSTPKYVSSVRIISRCLTQEFNKDYNLFEIESIHEFEVIRNIIMNSETTLVKYRSGHYQYSRGINLYKEFLENHSLRSKTSEDVEIIAESEEVYTEGAKYEVKLNKYERDMNARNKCLEEHGTVCKICGFDFGRIYGERFKGKIHVHHITPLSKIGMEYKVNPKKDLIPVCPNCHMILHAKNPPYTINEVLEMLETREKNNIE